METILPGQRRGLTYIVAKGDATATSVVSRILYQGSILYSLVRSKLSIYIAHRLHSSRCIIQVFSSLHIDCPSYMDSGVDRL